MGHVKPRRAHPPARRPRKRDRTAEPDEAKALIAKLDPQDRATWALAFYAGLRLGELRALRWRDVDFDQGELHVERSYCNVSRSMVAPKSHAGRRIVPMAGSLRAVLLEHRLLTRRLDSDLVITSSRGTPIETKTITRRAETAWGTDDPITLHEARHTYASLMIAAGVSPKELCEWMGTPRSRRHSTATATCSRRVAPPVPKSSTVSWRRQDHEVRQAASPGVLSIIHSPGTIPDLGSHSGAPHPRERNPPCDS